MFLLLLCVLIVQTVPSVGGASVRSVWSPSAASWAPSALFPSAPSSPWWVSLGCGGAEHQHLRYLFVACQLYFYVTETWHRSVCFRVSCLRSCPVSSPSNGASVTPTGPPTSGPSTTSWIKSWWRSVRRHLLINSFWDQFYRCVSLFSNK